MALTRGRSSGFDYMRLTLALVIVVYHSALTSYGAAADQAVTEGPARPLIRLLLPMFFALSGFLVAGSLERTKTLGRFLGLRIIRIFPALVVAALLSAFVLGPLVTTQPLADYFSDPLFAHYLLNVFGDVHFVLPGVFAGNPLPNIVNGQLWTIPFELYCYITLAVITMLGIKKRRILGPLFVFIVTVAYLAVTLVRHHGYIVYVSGEINGALLVSTFLSGVSIYLYRDHIPWSPAWGGTSLVLSMVLLAYIPCGDFFAPVPAAYATVCLGLTSPSRRPLQDTDYSYGIYVYGFVTQQTLVHVLPIARIWYINVLLSVPLVVLVAAASWHFVEKPANGLKPLLKTLENSYLRLVRKPDAVASAANIP